MPPPSIDRQLFFFEMKNSHLKGCEFEVMARGTIPVESALT